MFWFKAWNARNSRAIAKFRNAETGYFDHKMSIHDLIIGSLDKYWQDLSIKLRFGQDDRKQ